MCAQATLVARAAAVDAVVLEALHSSGQALNGHPERRAAIAETLREALRQARD